MITGTHRKSPRFLSNEFLSNDLNSERQQKTLETDLKSLRSRAWVLATRFAQSFECQDLIRPVPQGHGFYVETPDRPIRDDGDAPWWGWWLLVSLSEQAIPKARLELPTRGLRLPEPLIEDRLAEAFAMAGRLPNAIFGFGHVFLSSPQLSDRAFRDLLMLMETCRVIRNGFPESTLWPGPTADPLKKEEFR
ncbi:MAG: hypothetical protein L0Y39_01165 [Methylococcaceae bacterium]|nr:hypothetical protein [Methylococcaceae bacterium]